jgi:drug/metabolite transporter (DMT)-like permease
MSCNLEKSYQLACEKYSEYGVDVAKAVEALGKINLSLYALFSMLGGMALPFAQGILFYGERLTVAKIVCFIIIVAALALTLERGEKKKGTVYYVGVFVLNGMSGVISKIFTASEFPKTSAAVYSVWIAVVTIILSGAAWLIMAMQERRRQADREDSSPRVEKKALAESYALSALYGAVNRVSNFILVFALIYVDASVQYPMVTGGVMIVSTLIALFDKSRRPSKKEIISVLLAFIGTVALFIIPV